MADTAISLSDTQIDDLLNQAEVRLLEKQQAQQSKSVSAPRLSSSEVIKSGIATKTPILKPLTSAPSIQKDEKLSVRVPETRKSKKEMDHSRHGQCPRDRMIFYIIVTLIEASLPSDLCRPVHDCELTASDQAHKADAGPQWFNLPATDLTPELRRDLQLLKMRDVLDPKRHYKKDTTRAIPEFSQVGTIMPGPTDYFSARMTKKDRKRTLLEDVLATEDTTRRFKSKYGEIQAAKTSGKKGHYKKMMQKRYGRNYKG
ncbi:rRNA-processing protein FCF2 [Xylaria flabelliformis]|nr:rRNA-processing protein FCF2 [Xylaria flabelliformis]